MLLINRIIYPSCLSKLILWIFLCCLYLKAPIGCLRKIIKFSLTGTTHIRRHIKSILELTYQICTNFFSKSSIETLSVLRPDIMSKQGVNNIYQNIVHVLINNSLKFVPVKSNHTNGKHWWNETLSNYKQQSLIDF